jgi:hypothetical protein
LHGRADGRRVSEADAAVEKRCQFLVSIGAVAVELDVEGVSFRGYSCSDAARSDGCTSFGLVYGRFEIWLAGRKEIVVRAFVE